MEETLGVEGRFYLEEVSLTDTASSRGTISPLPMKVKPSGEYPVNDGKFFGFSEISRFLDRILMEHIETKVSLDSKLQIHSIIPIRIFSWK